MTKDNKPPSPSDKQTAKPKRGLRLDVKLALMAAACVLITAAALVFLAVWQSGEYNQLAQREVEQLIDADLDHITQGVYHLVRTENEAVQLQVDYNLKVARHILSDNGSVNLSEETVTWRAMNQFINQTEQLVLPKLLVGETWLGKNRDPDIETPVVDEVSGLVGETATIFQRMNEKGDMLRIATNVMTKDRKRAIGTYIPAVNPDGSPNPVVSAILRGETYHGRAYVVNAWYLTAYEPIKDTFGNLVGMLYVGVKQKAVESRVRHAILKTKVGSTGYVYVLGGGGEDRGRYIISYKGKRDGENVWSLKDSDDRYVIKEIINKAMGLGPGEMATIRYRWQNPGEPAPRWKIARLSYYAPWDWVIGTSVYEDELQTYSALLKDGRRKMTRAMGIAGLGITLLIGLVGILVTWKIILPIRQMTTVSKKIISGDLNQVVSVKSHDEIGILARTFNIMTANLKASLENLKESEKKYRGIFENAIEGLFKNTLDGKILNANPAMARVLGYDSPQDLMNSIDDVKSQLYVNSTDREKLIHAFLKQEKVYGFEVQFYRRGGQIIWVSISGRLIKDETGTPAFLEGFLTDITARKYAEEAFAESRNYLDEIINAIADPLFVKDSQHRWVLVNNAMCAFLGHTRNELLGKTDYDYSPKNEADEFWKNDEMVLTSGKENINEETFTDGNRVVHNLVTKKTLYTDKKGDKFIVGIIRDVTDQKLAEKERNRLEDQLGQSQKMEAIGTLAGGIAHDFNNILSAIIGYTELAMDEIPQESRAQEDLKEVYKAGNRAKELVAQILAFSRVTQREYSPIALRAVIKENLKMLRAVIPSNIEIRQNLKASGLVMSDPTEINQMVMNLCTNAVHAMDEAGGVLEVGLESVTIDNSMAMNAVGLPAGAYLKLTVNDNGKGMMPEVKERIFEPYFTTKEKGRGTGLGLSVLHGIVKSHNGTVTCDSIPGKGSEFAVYLPSIGSGAADARPVVKTPLPEGRERVLFVDDEEALAHLAEKMLGNIGYQVICDTNSMNALEIFRKDPWGVDVVITDMTMPGMTGDRLAKELIAIRPDIPIILCSGYNEHITEERAKEIGIREFILKPMDLRTMAETVRKVIDQSHTVSQTVAETV